MPSKPRLLYVLHQYDHLGGAELQTKRLAGLLGDDYDVAVAWIDKAGRRIVLRGSDGAEGHYAAQPVTHPLAPFHDAATQQSFDRLLRDFSPRIVHFQHFMYWPLSIIDQAIDGGAKVVVSLYDYYTITPVYTMLGAAEPEQVFTASYSLANFGVDATEHLRQRRQLMFSALSRADRRVVISPYLGRVLSRIHPLSYDCIEPGIRPFEPMPRGQPLPGLRFGYLGSFIGHKGLASLHQAFLKVRQKHPQTELRTYGGPAPRGQPPPGIQQLGAYGPDDLPRILGEFDVGVIPSLFAETYCIVLSEMWQANVPAAISDIGAMGERVTDGGNGRKFPPGDVDALAAVMSWFVETDDWRRWQLPKPRTARALAADHHAMYQSL